MTSWGAFVAAEENAKLAVVDLTTMKLLATYSVGEDPDVLAFDPVKVFRVVGKALVLVGGYSMPHAHTVSVDPKTHLVYFPLQDVDGHPVLRIMRPAKQSGLRASLAIQRRGNNTTPAVPVRGNSSTPRQLGDYAVVGDKSELLDRKAIRECLQRSRGPQCAPA